VSGRRPLYEDGNVRAVIQDIVDARGVGAPARHLRPVEAFLARSVPDGRICHTVAGMGGETRLFRVGQGGGSARGSWSISQGGRRPFPHETLAP
jgi:hypothetical protein